MFISYAQNFEDVILHRALKHIDQGFYIDVGAQDEMLDSVSRGFYERGWRGVHVEPVPEYADKLRQERAGDTVLEMAIAPVRGRLGFFSIPGTGISTGEMAIAQMHRAAGFDVNLIEVESTPLSDLLDGYMDRDIHWLKIDVEGMEAQVVKSWRPSDVRPWIVVVESTRPGTPQPNHDTWEDDLLSLGYDFVYFDGLNRFYVSHQHPELKSSFGTAPNCFDNFALAPSNRLSTVTAKKLAGTVAALNEKSEQLAKETANSLELISKLEEQNVWATNRHTELTSQIELKSTQLDAHTAEIARLAPFVTQLAQKEAEIAQLTASSQQEVARLTALATALRTQSGEIAAKLKQDLTTTRMNLINAQKELSDKQAQIGRTEATTRELRDTISALQNTVTSLNAQITKEFDRAEGFRRLLDEMAVTSNKQEGMINALRSSTSWRLTSPVRAVSSGTRNIISLPKSIVRGLLERALVQHRKRPQLATAIRSSAALFPPLNQRLRKFSALRLPASHLETTATQDQNNAQWWSNTEFAASPAITPSPLLQRADAIAAELARARTV